MPETVVRPTIKFIVAGFIAVFLAVCAAIVVNDGSKNSFIALVLFLWPLAKLIENRMIRLVVADESIRYEAGFLSKFTRTLQIAKMQDVTVHQSITQRIFGVGDVYIETAGGTSGLQLHNFDSPQQLADLIGGHIQSGSRKPSKA